MSRNRLSLKFFRIIPLAAGFRAPAPGMHMQIPVESQMNFSQHRAYSGAGLPPLSSSGRFFIGHLNQIPFGSRTLTGL